MLILRAVGFKLRRDSPIELKECIVNLQSRTNKIKQQQQQQQSSSSDNETTTNERLRFMIESINAIKNNDVRRLSDAFDQDAVEHVRKHVRTMVKDADQTLLNITYNDLINSDELGRWWIVGSAWNLKETNSGKTNAEVGDNQGGNQSIENKRKENSSRTGTVLGGEQFSEKILKLARQQHMNTDVRRAIFCILVSAEDFTDAFVKLLKLSLKKQQEREIIFIIVHCALNEKSYNPYYTYLLQKFCEYDRRFRVRYHCQIILI